MSRLELWIFVALVCLYGVATRGHFQTTDEVAVYQQTRSLWQRGDLDVAPMINAQKGPNGRWYAVYHVGQSLVALPFYAAGRGLGRALAASPGWTRVFAGPQIGEDPIIWGGEVEIFVVNLTSAFAMALLGALFFWLSRRLGAGARASLIATAIVFTTSYVAGFATCFFTHALESLALFAAWAFLVVDARAPDRRLRALGGAAAGLLVLVRFQAVVALPVLGAFVVWGMWRRGQRRIVVESLGFAVPVAIAIAIHVAVNWLKFGVPSLGGGHESRFDASLLETWYAFFFSIGKSVFVFTPLLLLAFAYWPQFWRRHRGEAICAASIMLAYLLLYGKYAWWHGEWCFGPRYLAALVPLALAPLASWWETASRRGKLAAGALAAAGLVIQILHVSVNFSYVNHAEKYEAVVPPFAYLFTPAISPVVAHWKALVAADYRVDPWLVLVYRSFGLGRALLLAAPLAAGFLFSVRKLVIGTR